MVYHYQTGDNAIPADVARKLLNLAASIERDEHYVNSDDSQFVKQDEASYLTKKNQLKMIPLLGWAHAGAPTNYDEVPEDWREMIHSECRDQNSFAIRIIGDSMSPSFDEGDVLVLMPSEEPFSGCLAVAKFANGDYVFRRFEFETNKVRCIAVNVRYPVTEYEREEFDWIYPVYESRRLVWRGK